MNHQPTTPTKVFPQVVPINFEKNRTADGNITDSYCAMVIPPKLEKLREKHRELLSGD